MDDWTTTIAIVVGVTLLYVGSRIRSRSLSRRRAPPAAGGGGAPDA